MVIAIAKYYGWPLDQLDVVTAFLYGIMKELVFCAVPEGVDLDGDFDCLELVKAIYGLKQASRVWNETFDEFVCSIGFQVSAFDPCLYIKVSWGSKKQSSVSLSTSEAEYIALSLAIQEGKWIRRLLCEILAATNETGPELKIREDNQSCIKMTKNPVNHGRAKHIDIKYHHIRDEVKRGEVKLEYCETSVMLADIMTKALPGPRHTDLTAALGIHACSH
ncbi:hypothetical protein PC121_g24750 [Phytophthora cactorum]|nr:hypothetical protein PC121_g24750 [Phytophthora cactorum]